MKTVLITGCSRGIGLRFVQHYVKNGWNVIATARIPDVATDLQEANPAMILPLDVTSEESIEKLQKSLDNMPIHLLINNAGILNRENDISSLDKKGLVDQFITNSVAPLLVASKLLPNLHTAKSNDTTPMIVNITSRMGSIDDNTSGGMYGYRASKAALNAMTKSLALDLQSSGVCAILLHPGYVVTDMTGQKGNITPEESVANMTSVIEKCDMSNTGTFYHCDGSILPW